MPILKYHQKSLELTGSQLEFNGESYPDLPASISEWFTLSSGINLLREYSNRDVPIHPSRFQVCKFQDKNLLVFIYENQRVACFAFENSNSEDPPVYIIYDPSDDDFPVEFISEHCFLIEDTFSGFIYKWLFDFSHWYKEGLFLISGSKKALDKDILDYLSTEFTKEPISLGHDGEVHIYRFSNNDQKIIVSNEENNSTWQLSASTKKSFDELHKKIIHLFE